MAETRCDWTRRHPVIRIDFGTGVLRDRAELDRRIFEILSDVQRDLGLPEPVGYDKDLKKYQAERRHACKRSGSSRSR